MDNGDDHEGWVLSSWHRHCGSGLTGTNVNVAVLPSPSPDRRRRPRKQRRVCQRGDRGIVAAVTAALVQCSHLTMRGSRAGAALASSDREGVDAMCRSMTATWAIKRAERARRRGVGDRRGGRRTRRGGEDAVDGGVASAVDDNGEDDGGGRWHHATTNPVMKTMSTMAAVADDDGVDGQRRR